MSQIRLTGGEYKGRSLHVPHRKTRPTLARIREAIFDHLQVQTPEARFLDLFAGSGALGIEALSRGASFVTFVENSRAVLDILKRNLSGLGLTAQQAKIIDKSVFRMMPALEHLCPFDVVLADPPYESGSAEKMLTRLPWEKILAPEGRLVVEHASREGELPEVPSLTVLRKKRFGDTELITLQRAC